MCVCVCVCVRGLLSVTVPIKMTSGTADKPAIVINSCSGLVETRCLLQINNDGCMMCLVLPFSRASVGGVECLSIIVLCDTGLCGVQRQGVLVIKGKLCVNNVVIPRRIQEFFVLT